MTEIGQAIQEVADTIRRKSRNSALINGVIFLAGIVITVGTLSSATKSGGVYFVFWGAIVFGLIGCVRAIARYVGADGEATSLVAMHFRKSRQ
jgi:uncharacterized protein YoaH (UPF0181 family)